MNWNWELTEGYSQLLEGSRLELQLLEGPWEGAMEFSPVGTVRRNRPLEFHFGVSRRFLTTGHSGLRWVIGPSASIRCRILFERHAFLGNFRVPEGSFAVEWDVEGEVEGGPSRSWEHWLIASVAGSRLRHSWVESFPGASGIAQAMQSAWKSFVDPAAASSVVQLRSSQVTRLTWTGFARFQIGLAWGLERGLVIPSRGVWELVDMGVGVAAGATFQAGAEIAGQFQLQVSRRSGRLRMSLRRQRTYSMETSFSVGVNASNSLRIKNPGGLLSGVGRVIAEPAGRPAMTQINRALRQAVVKKLEVSATASLESNRRRSTVLRADWSPGGPAEVMSEYAQLLSGNFPAARKGLKVSGMVEDFRSRKLSVKLNLLNWILLSKTRQKDQWSRISTTPAGDLAFESGFSVEQRHDVWGEIHFLDLFMNRRALSDREEEQLVLSWGREGRLSGTELKQGLLFGLRCGILNDFQLPPAGGFPRRLGLLFRTQIGREGLAVLLEAAGQCSWEQMVRAFEIAWPERYRQGESFWRDWIDSPQLRFEIERNPVQACLASRYPVENRTEAERRNVVRDYRRVLRLVDVLKLWAARDRNGIRDSYEPGFGLLFFVWFHLFCPLALRRSAALVSGELSRMWGDASLFQD